MNREESVIIWKLWTFIPKHHHLKRVIFFDGLQNINKDPRTPRFDGLKEI